ncbi:hypothetical protein CRM22_002105 [Opisthorchis felineus]|uniref:p53 DNA-binding domain-containing protein n=1 Tax=Opisthorchis felineus TaxID=147828 RepID=A0A4S2M7J6_OPIFE|nr:hypothetical protein CRM22_002105 [Opisthorchis felineus]TGZ72400.1 hypothetical protein CRM22_002105 [Opisthorchis felineus]TGZ72401.1 hypothetical protein CRM22_002105 [Opisthorchis felineus]
MEFLSQPPVVLSRERPRTPLTPFTGSHQFKVWVPKAESSADGISRNSGYGHQVIESHRFPMVYVQRNRRWPLAVAFRPAMTPVAYRLRVLPRFVDADRADDVIETCSKHFDKSSKSTKDRSFIHLLSPLAEYLTDNTGCGLRTNQISVLYPLDVLGLLKRSKIDSTSPTETREDFTDSQSHLLPEVRDMIDCRVNCYNSCFGAHVRGEINLLCTLEIKPNTDSECPFELAGMQVIRLRCCACPSRDLRGGDQMHSALQASASSPLTNGSLSSDRRRSGSRKLSLNVPFGSNAGPSTLTVDALWTLNPLASPAINVNGSDYFFILVPNRQQWRQLRMLRNCWLSSIDNSGPGRIKRICRTYDQLELKIAERLRHDPITCSQGSSTPPESSQCDKSADAPHQFGSPRCTGCHSDCRWNICSQIAKLNGQANGHGLRDSDASTGPRH